MRELFKRHKAASAILVYLIFIYAVFTVVVEPHPVLLERYNLTSLSYRFLITTVVLPVIAIWVMAFYGFMTFREYTGLIKDSKDGKGLTSIANGISILAIGLPVNAVIDAGLSQLFRGNPQREAFGELLANYVGILFAVVAFRLIVRGAEQLTRTIKTVRLMSDGPLVLLLLLSSMYCYLLFSPPTILLQQDIYKPYIYALPPWLVISTLIVPNLYVWFRGVSSAFYINIYRQNANGILYKKALHILAIGLALVILSTVLMQYFYAVTAQFNQLTLIPVLLIVYLLLAVIASGYVCIAIGAKRLRKIEEV